LTGEMFAVSEVVVDAGLDEARARLADLMHQGQVLEASRDAYDGSVTALIRVGPAPGVSRLVQVRLGGLVDHQGQCSLPVRWEATRRLAPGAGR
jgi:hypothetical protein